jgi:TrmH family RNA methyltransferase
MITSPHNDKLKQIRRLARRRERERTGLAVAEGEDLVAAAERAGLVAELRLEAGRDVVPELLAQVSALGSGSRVVGVYRQRWSEPGGDLSVYLEGVRDPGNVGTVIRSAHAFCDGPVVLGEGCADPWSPKAVRASMGSVFARPPARAAPGELAGTLVALDPAAGEDIEDIDPPAGPVVLCVGAEREGLSSALAERADLRARIPTRADAPESLNAAMAASIALHVRARAATRMAERG